MKSVLLILLFVVGSNAFTKKYVSRFSTKTAYRNLEKTGSVSIPSGCTPVAIDMVIRHGTRYPSESTITKLAKVVEMVRRAGSGTLVPQIYDWKSPFSPKSAGQLHKVGADEEQELGARILKLVSNLKLKPSNVQMYSSTYQRAIDSAKAFYRSIGSPEGEWLTTDDKMTRFYKYCPKYEVRVDKNNSAMAELEKFLKGNEISSLVKKTRNKLGLSPDEAFTASQLDSLYDICRFDTDLNTNISFSKWCNFFDDSAVLTMEYAADLERYWDRSYGYPINYLQSSSLLYDMLAALKSASVSGIRGRFRFGHSTTLLPLVTNLGVINNTAMKPLLANNFASQGDRAFKTSRIAPFSANVALILLNCSSTEAQLQLMPVLNEQNVEWSLCNSKYCAFDKVLAHFKYDSGKANQLDEICKLNGTMGFQLSSLSLILSVVVAIFSSS